MASSSHSQRDGRLATLDELEKSFSRLDMKGFKFDATGLLVRCGSAPELPEKLTKGTGLTASQQGEQNESGNCALNFSRGLPDGRSCKLCSQLKVLCHCRGRSLSPSLADSGEGELERFTSSSASRSSLSLTNEVRAYGRGDKEIEESPVSLRTGVEDFCKHLQSSSDTSSLSPTNENVESRYSDCEDALQAGLLKLNTFFQYSSGSSSPSQTDEENEENEDEEDEAEENEEDPEALRAGLEELRKCIPGLSAEDLNDPYKIICGAIGRIDALSKMVYGEDDPSRSPIYEFS